MKLLKHYARKRLVTGKRFRSQKGKALAEHLKISKENHNDDDNLKSVYLTLGEIDYLVRLILSKNKNGRSKKL